MHRMLALLFLLGTQIVAADDLTIPNTFQANTPARAADVNANFTAVEASVDDNAADIGSNALDISGNGSEIQTLNASVSTLLAGDRRLYVLFENPNINSLSCRFVDIPSNTIFQWDQQGLDVQGETPGTGVIINGIVKNLANIEVAKPVLLQLMINIGGLNIVVDDFRNPATGEFDCTNEKLFSLL